MFFNKSHRRLGGYTKYMYIYSDGAASVYVKIKNHNHNWQTKRIPKPIS